MKRPLGRILQRLEAAALAAGTLWLVGVTAGSDTAARSGRTPWYPQPPCGHCAGNWETCGPGTRFPPRQL